MVMTHTCARLKRRRHDQLNLIHPYGLIAILSDQSAGRRFVTRATQSSRMIQRVLKSRREMPMLRPPLDPDVDDLAPSNPALTDYDVEHLVCYLRLLDAEAEGADWRGAV
jgi:hypothetical protein